MAENKNALAELAERLDHDTGLVDTCASVMGFSDIVRRDIVKAQRIVAELAKVKLNGVGWPVRLELADAYEKCRAIAEGRGRRW